MNEFIEVESTVDALLLRLTRDVDGGEHTALVAELDAIVSNLGKTSNLVLDLSPLTFASAHILASLVRLYVQQREDSVELKVVVHRRVAKMLRAVNLNRVVKITEPD